MCRDVGIMNKLEAQHVSYSLNFMVNEKKAKKIIPLEASL